MANYSFYQLFTLKDAHTDDEGELHIDSEQNYILEDVTVTWDKTTITFSRKYDTCDDDDYVIDVSMR